MTQSGKRIVVYGVMLVGAVAIVGWVKPKKRNGGGSGRATRERRSRRSQKRMGAGRVFPK